MPTNPTYDRANFAVRPFAAVLHVIIFFCNSVVRSSSRRYRDFLRVKYNSTGFRTRLRSEYRFGICLRKSRSVVRLYYRGFIITRIFRPKKIIKRIERSSFNRNLIRRVFFVNKSIVPVVK